MTAMSAKGRIDEPHERSPTTGFSLRAVPCGADRANRYVSEEEARQGPIPMRSAYGAVVKANEPSHTRCWRRRATASAAAVKSLLGSTVSTSERWRRPARDHAPGSQRETL